MKKILTAMILSASILMQAKDLNDLSVPVGPIEEMSYSMLSTRFCLWSPMAIAARVLLYKDGSGGTCYKSLPMQKNYDGTWAIVAPGDMNGFFYTFQVEVDGEWQAETPGIFAKAVGINGQRAQVIDMRTTDPEGWQEDRSPAVEVPRDVVIYEMHHRDMSVDKSSGITHKGKFLALTEHGTHNKEGQSTGIDHLKELGVTHIHILPSYDFGSIDETTGYAIGGGGRDHVSQYNWGYDPVNYNVPEGSYSTNAADPAVRIREFKQMVQALHKAGMRVVLDVVYNHVFDLQQSNFQRTAPDYFFRHNADGTAANGSGCGNETASERPMMRKFMVESVLYWMREYHIDGFRFDLMGIHDIETMNAIRQAAQSIDPNVLIYGEGWAASSPVLSADQLAMKANTSQLGGIAAFGDEMRDGLRGGWQDDKEGAFLIGRKGYEESVKYGIVGAIEHPGVDYSHVNYSKEAWAAEPMQMISYVSCHDDMCITDRLNTTIKRMLGHEDSGVTEKLLKLAETVTLTSQGIPFIWCGDEIMRDRKGVHNCFASPDSINAIDWQLKSQHKDVFDYISTLIQMRKAHPAFRMNDADKVRAHLQFIDTAQSNVVAYRIDGKSVEDEWEDIIVIFNSNVMPVKVKIPAGNYTAVVSDGKASLSGLSSHHGKSVKVAGRSAMILVK